MEICLSVRHDDRGISDWIFHVTCGWLHGDCATNLTQISDVPMMTTMMTTTTIIMTPVILLTSTSFNYGKSLQCEDVLIIIAEKNLRIIVKMFVKKFKMHTNK